MSANNAINNQSFSYNGMPLWGVNFVRLQGSISTSPSATIYTVPSGKKAVGYQFMFRNTTGGNTSIATRYIISGNNYDTIGTSLSNTNSRGEGVSVSTLSYPGAMVMNAGESFALVGSNIVASLQYFITMLEFDDNVPWYSARNLNINASPFTLYTVPAGKKALIGAQTYMGTGAAYTTGNTSLKSIYFVDNGGVLGTNNLVYSFTLSGSTVNFLTQTANENENCMAVLASGDTIQVTQATISGTNWMFINVYEVND